MKLKGLTIIICSLLIVGCTTDSKNEKEEKDVPNKEKVLLLNKKTENESNSNFLLEDKSVGKFKIGSLIPFPKTSDDYTIDKATQTRMTDEGPAEEIVYKVLREGVEILQLKPEYDYEKAQYTQKTGEIILTSSVVKTAEGIGVGSTIEDFIAQYPNYKIWYTYVSGMYVLESNDLNGQFILNEKDFIGQLNNSGDMTILKKSDFKNGAKILKIRIL